MMTGKINVPNIRALAAELRGLPEYAYDQSTWARRTTKAPCGTAGCIAGRCYIKVKGLEAMNEALAAGHDLMIMVLPVAQEYLGLDDTGDLFTCDPGRDWPEPFRSDWKEALDSREQANVAASYLEAIADGRATVYGEEDDVEDEDDSDDSCDCDACNLNVGVADYDADDE